MKEENNARQAGQGYKLRLVFLVFVILVGAFIGALLWLFLIIMDLGLELFWEILPSHFDFAAYPLVLCALGGVVIGLCQRKIGVYPEELSEVLAKVKETGRYDYKRAPGITLCALLPLVFGGSVGPEAGLTGVIAGLCTWAGDRFKHVASELKELAVIGMSAALGVIFNAPLFGFVAPIEDEDGGMSFPKKTKTVINIASILGGIGTFLLLKSLFGGGLDIGHFGDFSFGSPEALWFVPLALAGAIAGAVFNVSEELISRALAPLERFFVLRAVGGGLLLGLCGLFLPYAMFAGESQMGMVMNEWTLMSVGLLLLTGFVKLIITNVCLNTGWRGGNIFPIIFAGVCFGYAAAHLTGADSVFAVAVITAALCGAVMRKPLAVALLLLLCFPGKALPIMLAAAYVGSELPLPGKHRKAHGKKPVQLSE